VKEFEIFFAV